MLADHGAAAKGRKADIAGIARAGMPVAAAHGAILQGDLAAFRRRLAEEERGAGGRIHLHAVVHLQDLDVEVFAERRRDLAHEAREQVDAERHVAGLDDARMARGRLQLGEIGLLQAGGADHVDDAGLGGERREGRRWRQAP